MENKKINSPTEWADIKQIETWVGEGICEENSRGGRAKLTVIHHCGEDKEELIGQLETMIESIRTGGEEFGC